MKVVIHNHLPKRTRDADRTMGKADAKALLENHAFGGGELKKFASKAGMTAPQAIRLLQEIAKG